MVATAAALVAFASNSLLCRVALSSGAIDPATFTIVRLASGAMMLALVAAGAGRRAAHRSGNWASAAALAGYALAFSLAYVRLDAAIGALLLFGAVQLTIVAAAAAAGERAGRTEWIGLGLALAGLLYLVAPGLTAPPAVASMLMIAAGMAWGIYTIRGRGVADPLQTTAGNFVRGVPLAFSASAAAAFVAGGGVVLSPRGVMLAALSGAVTSALGYVVWYEALRSLTAMRAAIVQLAVPVLTALAAAALLDERITLRLVTAGALILGGIALATVSHRRR